MAGDRVGLPFDVDYPRALLWTLTGLLAVVLVVAASVSGAAFGVYNPGWDGAAELRAVAADGGAEVTVLRNTTAYGTAPPNRTVAVVLSPETAYAPGERARIRRFVEAGGTLVVAEDFGPHGDALLAGVGARARFDGRLLRDERFNYRSSALPVTRNVTNHSLVAGTNSLTLNYATVVDPGAATVLVASSGYGYLDADRDGDLDADERLRSYPVATVERVGDGRVVAVSDPSVFVNAMLDRSGNRRFARSLLAADRVLLDYSHAGSLPPLAALVLVLRDAPLLQALLGLCLVAVVVAWRNGIRPGRGGRVGATLARLRAAFGLGGAPDGDAAAGVTGFADVESVTAYLRRRHPDWDPERARRVAEAALRRRDRRADD